MNKKTDDVVSFASSKRVSDNTISLTSVKSELNNNDGISYASSEGVSDSTFSLSSVKSELATVDIPIIGPKFSASAYIPYRVANKHIEKVIPNCFIFINNFRQKILY